MARCMIMAGSEIRDRDTDLFYVVGEDTHIEATRLPVYPLGSGIIKSIEMRHSWDANAINIDLSEATLEEY